MILFNKKYRKTIATVVLICFIIISAFSILHYHRYSLNNSCAISNQQKDNRLPAEDGNINGLQFICSIKTNYSSLQSTNCLESSDFSIVDFESYIFPALELVIPHQTFHPSANHLRAPPVNS